MDSKNNKEWDSYNESKPDAPGISTHKKTLTNNVDPIDLTGDNDEEPITAPITITPYCLTKVLEVR